MADFYSNVSDISVTGTNDGDKIRIYGSRSTLTAMDGNDDISVNSTLNGDQPGGVGNNVIFGEGGDDFVKVETANEKVYGGTGKDTIRYDGLGGKNSDANFYGDGGADDDVLYLSTYAASSSYEGKKNITLKGGSGDDTINVDINSGYYDSSKAMSFVVEDFSGEDTFKITYGDNDTSKAGTLSLTMSGEDAILTDGSNFTATLKGVEALANIADAKLINGSTTTSFADAFDIADTDSDSDSDDDSDSDSDDDSDSDSDSDSDTDTDIELPTGITIDDDVMTITNQYSGSSVDVAEYSDDVKTVIASSRTKKIAITGNEEDNDITGGSKADTLAGGVGDDTLTGGNGADVFVHTEGNDVITDYKVGTDKIKLDGTEITGADVDGDNLILSTANGSITVLNANGKKLTIIDSEGVTSKVTYPETVKSPSLPKNVSYSNSGKTAVKISNSFNGDKVDMSEYTNVKTISAVGTNHNMEIYGNDLNNSIVGGKGDETLYGAKGNDTLKGNGGADLFMHTEGNDVITDYTQGTDKIYLFNTELTGTTLKGSDAILYTDNGSITVKNGKNKTLTVMDESNPDGRELKVGTLAQGLSTVRATNGDVTLNVKKNYEGSDIILGEYFSTVTKVDATNISSSVNVNIEGNSRNNSLKGGSGDDTLAGGTGKDTLTGGNGNDIFIVSDGNDVITDYKPGDDKIYLGDTNIVSAKIGVKDVILNLENGGSVTVKNGYNKKITTMRYDSDEGEMIETTKTYPVSKYSGLTISAPNVIVKKSFDYGTVDLSESRFGSSYRNVDASAYSDDIEIYGNDKNNSLVGGSGNNTLAGGSGSDTLKGGSGNDTFVHYEGKDVIVNYKSGDDVIQLDDTEITKVKVSGSDVVFTTDTGSITVKKGKGKKITVVNEDGDETVYKNTQVVSSSNVSEVWFDDENEFATAAKLSDITKTEVVADVEIYKSDKLTQENLVTFAK